MRGDRKEPSLCTDIETTLLTRSGLLSMTRFIPAKAMPYAA
jgi:hypothetical protein